MRDLNNRNVKDIPKIIKENFGKDNFDIKVCDQCHLKCIIIHTIVKHDVNDPNKCIFLS